MGVSKDDAPNNSGSNSDGNVGTGESVENNTPAGTKAKLGGNTEASNGTDYGGNNATSGNEATTSGANTDTQTANAGAQEQTQNTQSSQEQNSQTQNSQSQNAQAQNAQAQNSQSQNTQTPTGAGFAGAHGALHLDGVNLVDQNGSPIQLYGMSTHGLAWFPDYVNYDGFKTLRDDWNTNCVRLAMYPHEYGGYCTGGDQSRLKSLVQTGVDAATDLGMYVIIDWHVLQEQDPNVYKEQAKTFFDEMSRTYADHTNVLYEICNEPNGSTSWDSVKSYAEEVIPVIRANDPDAIIIVGTPTWSQDIDKAKAKPLDFDNVMYALHFYAGTHKDVLWNRLDSCVQNGLPVFISEFGMCDASGNGANDFNSAQNWFNVIERYNLSFCCWNLANKNESSSVISPSCSKTSGWSEDELSESGKWIRNYFRSK
ncbi:MAG: glycoside hydrolase family 5 protein [Lachnospiraceae bacterium]|nr:glycoside hydrolase family 5 protein [Lachnospiraceae bacterium]